MVHNPTTVCAADTVTFRMWSSLKDGNEAITGGQTVITGKIKNIYIYKSLKYKSEYDPTDLVEQLQNKPCGRVNRKLDGRC